MVDRRVWRALGMSLVVIMLAWPVHAASQRDHDDCLTEDEDIDLDRRIAACTAILQDPDESRDHAVAYYNRGFSYQIREDMDRAIADYGESIRIDPEDTASYTNRGFAYWAKGDLDRAIANYSEVIRLDPEDALAYRDRGITYSDKGDTDRAFADYDEAIRLDPEYAFAYRTRGIAHLYGGSLAEAEADFQEAADLNPRNAYTALWFDIAERRNGGPGHLAEAARRLDMTAWPAPIVRLFLGEMTMATTFAAADEDAENRRDQICEANFYGAEFLQLQGQKAEALPLYRLAVSDCRRNFLESYAASWALRALGTEP